MSDGYGQRGLRPHRCFDLDCSLCSDRAEAMAADIEADYDLDGAANTYERQFDR